MPLREKWIVPGSLQIRGPLPRVVWGSAQVRLGVEVVLGFCYVGFGFNSGDV